MEKSLTSALFSCLLFGLLVSSYAQSQTCQDYSFSDGRQYTTCTDLSVLNSFLHWTYESSTNVVDIAFRRTGASSTTWTAWALNPSGPRMAGSQALVAFQNSSGVMHAYTSSLPTSGLPSMASSDLSFQVSNLSASLQGSEMIIFAKLQLTSDLLSTNQVWQEGPMNGDTPNQHALSGANAMSTGTIDFTTGQTQSNSGSVNSRQKRRNTHGVLNAVSWGVLMPAGAMMARYLKVFKVANPAWFYLHIACQSSGYIVGVAGWATGIKLGKDNTLTEYTTHRNIGITLFALATLQMFALLLRPKPDHKYRLYWNIYHHSIGYTVIILSIINIFKGFDILNPEDEYWKWIYIGILIFLGCVAILLEAITWYIVLNRRKENSHEKNPYSTNGVSGVNGHGARTQQGV